MNYLKKAKTAIKDVQEIQKGFKELGVQVGGNKHSGQPVASSTAPSTIAAPSVAAHSTTSPSVAASGTAVPGVAAYSIAAPPTASRQLGHLTIARCQAGNAPSRLSLRDKKKIRDDFEAKIPELEKKLSELLGAAWIIHADIPSLHTYMGNESGARANPGVYIYRYFDGLLSKLEEFRTTHGTAAMSSINDYAPQRIVTLEPTSDREVRFNTMDFFEGRWRILFRDTAFGTNAQQAGYNLSKMVYSPFPQPVPSMNTKHDIEQEYERRIQEVLNKIRTILAAPNLVFSPNLEGNSTSLTTCGVKKEKFGQGWDRALREATIDYYDGLRSQLEWQGFKGDEMMQNGFKEAVPTLTVSLLVVPEITRKYNDCMVENGVLVIRTKPEAWWSNVDAACDQLSEQL